MSKVNNRSKNTNQTVQDNARRLKLLERDLQKARAESNRGASETRPNARAFPKAQRDLQVSSAANQVLQLVAARAHPFEHGEGVRYPDIDSRATSTFTVRQRYSYDVPASGDFGFVVRDHPYAMFSATDYLVANGNLHSFWDGSLGVPATALWPPQGVSTMSWQAAWASHAMQCFDGCASASSILSAYSAIRVVSMGLRIIYEGAVLDTKGSLSIANLPSTQALPVFTIKSDGTSYPAGTNTFDSLGNPGTLRISPTALATGQESRVCGPADLLKGIEIIPEYYGGDEDEWLPTRPTNFALGVSGSEYRVLGTYGAPPTCAQAAQTQALMIATSGAPNGSWVPLQSQFIFPFGKTTIVGAGEGFDPSATLTFDVIVHYEGVPMRSSFVPGGALENKLASQAVAAAANHIVHHIEHVSTIPEKAAKKSSVLGKVMQLAPKILGAINGVRTAMPYIEQGLAQIGGLTGSDALIGASGAVSSGSEIFDALGALALL